VRKFSSRAGLTLPEVLIFMVLMAMMSATVLPMLFNSTESRQRQDAIALVEQNGAQVMQSIERAIRDAELVLDPDDGKDGYILALQMENQDANPTLIVRERGSIILVRGRTRRALNSNLVGVTHFSVTNTSVGERQSVSISIGLRRTIRVLQPVSYEATFNTVVTLHPDDDIRGDPCGCTDPVGLNLPKCEEQGGIITECQDDEADCQEVCEDAGGTTEACAMECDEDCENAGTYVWGICEDSTCVPQTDFYCDLIDEN